MKSGQKAPLRRSDMNPDPMVEFSVWLQEAERAGVALPIAMTLATANRSARPAARTVLLRGVDERGFVFFSNYESRKGRELAENPYAALTFHWLPLSRQVRVEGRVEKLEANESDAYFDNRPRGRRIGAHASAQSRVIKDRYFLEQRFADAVREFEGQAVPRPAHWGGYRVVPDLLEFWREGEHRLHDRLRYRRDNAANWVLERLAP